MFVIPGRSFFNNSSPCLVAGSACTIGSNVIFALDDTGGRNKASTRIFNQTSARRSAAGSDQYVGIGSDLLAPIRATIASAFACNVV